jgi:choloylglycine hydrolase
MQNCKAFYKFAGMASIAVAMGLAFQAAEACTRILWNNNHLAVVVGRSMDWPISTEPKITVFPRGMTRDGGRLGPEEVVTENPASWASKYGSMVVTVYGVGAADGFNEHGLAAHMLYLTATDFGPRDPGKPGLQAGFWAQYVLDNAATVGEALAELERVQLVMTEARGRKATVHLAIEDASGDSAIIEYVDGKPVIHHGRDYRIMTNDPAYDQQLALLEKQDFSHPSSDMPLPGNVNPRDRFQRAGLLCRAAARAEDRARSDLQHFRHRPQCLGPLRRAVQELRHLQHRISHDDQPHRQALFF